MTLKEFNNSPSTSIHEPQINKELIREEESLIFKEFLRDYPEKEHSDITEKLSYIREYMLNFPAYDGEDWSISTAHLQYYRFRDKIIGEINLSEEEFYGFQVMQESIEFMDLSPKATFELIAFLWDILNRHSKNGIRERMEDRLKSAVSQMESKPNDCVSLDLKIGKRHYKFNNKDFIQSLITSYLNLQLQSGNITEVIYPTKREIEYCLLSTLLTHLPIKLKKKRRGRFTQAERNFGLSVLWLIGGINHKKVDDPYVFCTKYNIATFDKLMRDYKDTPPFANPNLF